MYYLMVKEIEQTGMKYLCKRKADQNDPTAHIRYKGSGVLWRRMLKKHPEYTIKTTVLGLYTKDDLKKTGMFYSELYNVVDSGEWANLIAECGDGGDTSNTSGYKKAMAVRKPVDQSDLRTAHNPQTGEIRRIRRNQTLPKGMIWGNVVGKSYGPTGQTVYNNGKRIIYVRSNDRPPEGFVRGHLRDGSTLGRIGIHNPQTNQKKYIQPNDPIPEGWVEGLPPTTGMAVETPHGTFNSIQECMDTLNMSRYQIKKNIKEMDGWSMITESPARTSTCLPKNTSTNSQ